MIIEPHPRRLDQDARCAGGDARQLIHFVAGKCACRISGGNLPADVEPAARASYIATVVHGMAVQAAGGASRAELRRVAKMALRLADVINSLSSNLTAE